jgi:transcriptional regulator with XRE-family HTH domain
MTDAAALIRHARQTAGLTQRELAERLNMTQSAIAKLERPGANPTVDTLDRVLRGTQRRLELVAPSWGEFDIDLLRENLGLTMTQRLEAADRLAAQAHQLRATMVRRP